MVRTVRTTGPDVFGVREQTVRLTTEEWSACLFANETLTMGSALRPVVVYDFMYATMRSLRFEHDWDGLIDMRDQAEELDSSMRFGMSAFPKLKTPETRTSVMWMDHLSAQLREAYFKMSESGDNRDFRRRLRALRDAHVKWIETFPSASENCVYFLHPNETVYFTR